MARGRKSRPTMTFNARAFALGWLSVAVASSNDDGRPLLYRTVNIERFERLGHAGVMLVATDSYILLRTWVPAVAGLVPEADSPELDEAPDDVFVVRDVDLRGSAMMKFLKTKTSTDEFADVELTIRFDEKNVPGLAPFPGMEKPAIGLELPEEELVILDVYEGPPIHWRNLTEHHGRLTKVSGMQFRTSMLKQLGKLSTLYPGSDVKLDFHGRSKGVNLTVFDAVGEERVNGLFMPVATTKIIQKDALEEEELDA